MDRSVQVMRCNVFPENTEGRLDRVFNENEVALAAVSFILIGYPTGTFPSFPGNLSRIQLSQWLVTYRYFSGGGMRNIEKNVCRA